MTDRGMKQRPLQTCHQVEPFFFLPLILTNKVDQRAEPGPQPGPWRACCQGATWPETLAVLPPGPVGWKVSSAWAPGCGVEEEGMHLWSRGQEIQVV